MEQKYFNLDSQHRHKDPLERERKLKGCLRREEIPFVPSHHLEMHLQIMIKFCLVQKKQLQQTASELPLTTWECLL